MARRSRGHPRLDPRLVEEFQQAFVGEIDSLAALYRDAAGEMLRVLADPTTLAGPRNRALALLRQYQAILAELDDEAAAWIEMHLPRAYQVGVEFADQGVQQLRRAGINLRSRAGGGVAGRRQAEVFAQVHREAVQAIVAEMLTVTSAALAQIGRRVDDAFRRVGIEEVAKGIAQGKARREVSKEIAARLQAAGKPVFVDRLGREWPLDRYAEMVARTTTREAMTQGTINRLREHGITLMQVSAHNANDFCLYYENAIVNIGDEPHPVYPPISAINGGTPFHPKCNHVMTPFVERLATPEELERGKISPELLNRTPADLQRQFRRDYPERARAEGRRLRQEAKKSRERLQRLAKVGDKGAQRVLRTRAERQYPLVTDAVVRRDFGPWRESLTDQEVYALRLYQSTEYREWNEALRAGKVTAEQERYIKQIDSALAKGETKRDMTVFRGFSYEHLTTDLSTLKGRAITDAGFVSASLERQVGERFAGYAYEAGRAAAVAEIRLPKGTKAGYLQLTLDSMQESELLLPRGTRFFVKDAIIRPDGIAKLVLEIIP